MGVSDDPLEKYYDAIADRQAGRSAGDQKAEDDANRKIWESFVEILDNSGDRINDVVVPREIASHIAYIGRLLLSKNKAEEIEALIHDPGTPEAHPTVVWAQESAVIYFDYLETSKRSKANKTVRELFGISDDTLLVWKKKYKSATWATYLSHERHDVRVKRLKARIRTGVRVYRELGHSQRSIEYRGKKDKTKTATPESN